MASLEVRNRAVACILLRITLSQCGHVVVLFISDRASRLPSYWHANGTTRQTRSRASTLSISGADGLSLIGGRRYLPGPPIGGRQWELPSWGEHYRLTASDWPDFRAAVRDALSGGPLTVVELGDVLTKRRVYRHLKPVFDEGAGTLIKPLTWQGDISFGPPRDGQHTFQRLDSNPRWHGIPTLDDAGPRAIVAYLRTYGPATLDHVHYWLGNCLSAGRKRLDNWFSGLGETVPRSAAPCPCRRVPPTPATARSSGTQCLTDGRLGEAGVRQRSSQEDPLMTLANIAAAPRADGQISCQLAFLDGESIYSDTD